jgi:hypothetical protein
VLEYPFFARFETTIKPLVFALRFPLSSHSTRMIPFALYAADAWIIGISVFKKSSAWQCMQDDPGASFSP